MEGEREGGKEGEREKYYSTGGTKITQNNFNKTFSMPQK